ncbi:hypothetical protein GCM10009840_09210 [Pseudolysinimonas kribbensis]|uniref:DUF4097 domain-containing protein n=1 Tax=Pseudolysinimonas kribbensis TaxID=433641 RepID=A0ABQ6K6G2_9MICO|nr:DUF4097 family beta strand repeat-containing protein [Pseudolysinimonas kribbensis]GMA95326.1 hypothetical protein GCM10025881_21500 [Pseudolysinimonas kribbensis]
MAQDKWLLEGPKTIDVEGIRRLKVGLIRGQVDIIGHDEPGTRVEVHSVSGRDLKVAVTGDTLEIDHPQIRWDNWIEAFKSFRGTASADVSIMVPREVALRLGVVSATALVSGLHEDASISTVSGDVTADGVNGDLQVNAVSGEIAVRNHYGKVAVHTVSGDVTVAGEVLGFTCDGVSGEVMLDLTGTPDEVKVNTVSGDTTLRLDADVPAAYTISTVSGRLQLDATQITGVRGRWTGKFGELDRRWLDFRVNSVSGNVSVLHAVRATASA